MKTLKQLLEKTDKAEPTAPIEPDSVTSYVPKTKDEKRFMDKHVVQKTDDANKNGDDLFRGSNIKAYDRSATRHGYNTKEDQKVYESKTLSQILGEKTLSAEEAEQIDELKKSTVKSYANKKQAELDDVPPMPFKKPARSKAQSEKDAKGMMRALARMSGVKPTSEEVDFDQLDEAARHDQYSTYHAGVKDMLKKLGAAVDAHKEAAMSPTDYNKEKGGNLHSGHVYAMKNIHRTLQDMHDNLQQDVEYAQPPKPLKKEETDLFSCFDEETRERVQQVYEHLDDENKQIVIEMIEAKEYDELVEIVNEVLNG